MVHRRTLTSHSGKERRRCKREKCVGFVCILCAHMWDVVVSVYDVFVSVACVLHCLLILDDFRS